MTAPPQPEDCPTASVCDTQLFNAFRRVAFRYWEKRRLWYNLALIPPTLLGYAPSDLSAAIGDQRLIGRADVACLFVLSALGANICYSFAYAVEFFFATDDTQSRWQRLGRPFFLVSGILFGMVLAFIGGRNISMMEYHF